MLVILTDLKNFHKLWINKKNILVLAVTISSQNTHDKGQPLLTSLVY